MVCDEFVVVEGEEAMRSRISMIVFLMSLLIVSVAVLGCSFTSECSEKVVYREPKERAAWVAYWDADSGLKDLGRLDGKVKKVSFFGAYFDEDEYLFVPKELESEKVAALRRKGGFETYLSVVNDKQNGDGTAILKDVNVLRRMFADETVMDEHVDEIIALTKKGGYDGVEIDYERIWKDEEVSRKFTDFLAKVQAEASKKKLKVRVVLEPAAFTAPAKFPEGPEYVVMFYNLYGLHSGPGPKADADFIRNLLTRIETLPGEVSVALATGGCVWSDDGDKRFVSEGEAKALAIEYDVKPQRDKASQCLVFQFARKGVQNQVWYADVNTLNYWISLAGEKKPVNISLWRLGGNVDIGKLF